VIRGGHEVEIDKRTLDSDRPGSTEDKCEPTGNPTRSCRFKHDAYHFDDVAGVSVPRHFRISGINIRRGSESMLPPFLPVDRQKVFLSIYYCHPGPQCH
jgi:hypothetical protein